MMKHTLLGIVAAALIAAAGTVSATPGKALACPLQLGENCVETGSRTLGQTAIGGNAIGLFAIKPDSANSAAGRAPDTAMQFAAGGCGAAAASAAASQGGQVIGAPRKVQQGNRTMCVVTVLIKDPSGQRPPTRRTITVPAN